MSALEILTDEQSTFACHQSPCCSFLLKLYSCTILIYISFLLFGHIAFLPSCSVACYISSYSPLPLLSLDSLHPFFFFSFVNSSFFATFTISSCQFSRGLSEPKHPAALSLSSLITATMPTKSVWMEGWMERWMDGKADSFCSC